MAGSGGNTVAADRGGSGPVEVLFAKQRFVGEAYYNSPTFVCEIPIPLEGLILSSLKFLDVISKA